jgi:hypothetical protein
VGGHWQPPTLVRIPHVGTNNPQHVQQVIRDVIAAHPEDYKHVGDWEKSAIKAIKQMIPESQWNLLNQVFTPTEVENKMDTYQKKARDEKLKQIALQKAKAAAEARGEDPGSVTRSDQYETKKKEERKEPIDEDNARLDRLYKDYPQESHLRP